MGRAQAETTPKRVLLVEDNEDAIDIYGATLRHAGYDVMMAPTIADAEAAVRAQKPDVVVLDCRLPDGDGLGLLERWRKPKALMADVPVIVVTASGVRQDMEAALLAGADVFVHKPCPGNVLVLHVERALSGSRASTRLRKV